MSWMTFPNGFNTALNIFGKVRNNVGSDVLHIAYVPPPKASPIAFSMTKLNKNREGALF